MRILFLDIEVSPTLATVWGIFNQNIAINQLIGDSEVLTWVARWYGEKEYHTGSLLRDGKRKMLKNVHDLLDAADAVVTWNGNGFDLKVLNKEFLLKGMSPYAPVKSVDLLQVSRNRFRFISNKMDYVAHQLGLGGKKRHRGHQMWLDCMARKPSAFAEMLEYNKQDVVLLEKLYVRFLPWITNHPNHSAYAERAVCTNCGSEDVQRRGTAVTRQMHYQRFQCGNCGSWFRGSKPIKRAGERMVSVSA